MELKDYVFLNKELKDTYVVDVHIHVGGSTRYQKPRNDADSVVYTMNRLGIDVTCASCSPVSRKALLLSNRSPASSTRSTPC